MSRYDALTHFLASQPPEKREIRMWFREIEQIVGTLPASARQFRPWWGNSTHAHALSWQRAGWKVDTVILTSELVVFVRGQAERRSLAPAVEAVPLPRTIMIRDSASSSEAEVQARQWFSHALLKALLMRDAPGV
jgi:hypothetical protein